MDKRPKINEFIPYYERYINLVPEGNIEEILVEQVRETMELLTGLTDNQAHFQYGPDKWSIKEVVGHITDTERIMSYRLLSVARGEQTPLPGYNDDSYVQNASFNRLSIKELLENLEAVRHTTVLLLKSLKDGDWLKEGNANGGAVTVRALAWIIAGHELHHRNLLKDRYMVSI